ncbi:hypothetical protein [Puniceibacterium sediminis]|uniref:Uncharacterized protein n=1 Tax=Puniceibacterium sediminis TaxID=1608407 RepID=A0A238Z1T9_9RHOB|nr:hypothetical protein [Puniceibacterium sediminis]SNR76908.1 hypothetical protein SAMN06265370_12214 [Puniceibacterium sediminis]
MTLSSTLDLTIGLIFIYLVLSLLCTSANEAIAGLLRLRARILFSEVSRMIEVDDVNAAFWSSGLVRSLGHSIGIPDSTKGNRAPSYMESNTFSIALLHALSGTGKIDGAELTRNAPLDIVGLAGHVPQSSILKSVIDTLATDGQARYENLQSGLSDWFDQVMNRATGVYKRRMQLTSFLVALLVATAMNADTLHIAAVLWKDDALRDKIVVSAIETSRVDETVPKEILDKLETLRADLPFGWSGPEVSQSVPTTPQGWLLKGLGIFLTALAMTLGAPFWFDLLKRFVSIRGAGPVAAPAPKQR